MKVFATRKQVERFLNGGVGDAIKQCNANETDSTIVKSHRKRSKTYIQSLTKRDQRLVNAYQTGDGDLYPDIKNVYYSFNQLNAYLRGAPDPNLEVEDEPMSEKQQQAHDRGMERWKSDLLRIIKRAPKSKHVIRVYRGVSRNIGLRPEKGTDIVTLSGFISTSWTPNIPYQYSKGLPLDPNPQWVVYARKHNKGIHELGNRERAMLTRKYGRSTVVDTSTPLCCLMEIIIPIGTPLLFPYAFDTQQEIVLPHHSRFQFLGKTTCLRPPRFDDEDTTPIPMSLYRYRLLH